MLGLPMFKDVSKPVVDEGLQFVDDRLHQSPGLKSTFVLKILSFVNREINFDPRVLSWLFCQRLVT